MCVCVCVCVCVCLPVCYHLISTFIQKAAVENARKYKPIVLKVVLLQRYNHVKSENMLFWYSAVCG